MAKSKASTQPPEMPKPEETGASNTDNEKPDVVPFPDDDQGKSENKEDGKPDKKEDPPAENPQPQTDPDLAAENARLKAQVAGLEQELADARDAVQQAHQAADMVRKEAVARSQTPEGVCAYNVYVRRPFGYGEHDFHRHDQVGRVELLPHMSLNQFLDYFRNGFLTENEPE